MRNVIVSVWMVLSLTSFAAAQSTFGFEEFPGTNGDPGVYTTISSTVGGLTLTITRSQGQKFDVQDTTATLGWPPTWGNRCLSPFFKGTDDDYFIGNFSAPLTSVSLEMTDFGMDSDTCVLNAYSGLNGSGTLLGTDSKVWGTDSSPNFLTLNVAGSSPPIQSITFVGGSTIGPNSMYVDNIIGSGASPTVPEPMTLSLLGIGAAALLRRRSR